jgi:hypothetical protein
MARDIRVRDTMATGNDGTDGFTLRDLFAAAALAGSCAHHDNGLLENTEIARDAWELADAMLAARDTVPAPAGEIEP